MSTQHTKGPWEALRQGIEVRSESGEHEIFAYPGNIPVGIATVQSRMTYEHDLPVGKYELDEAEGLANLRRIVACVNACEGMETELIEAEGVILAGSASAKEVMLREQRDELLAALMLAEKAMSADYAGDMVTAFTTVRTAIARAKRKP
jgi:hypothetical protein